MTTSLFEKRKIRYIHIYYPGTIYMFYEGEIAFDLKINLRCAYYSHFADRNNEK